MELIKAVALKAPFNFSVNHIGIISKNLLKQCERTNKIITRHAHESISDIMTADSKLSIAVLQVIVQVGLKHCNRSMRQICINLIKLAINEYSEHTILKDILAVASFYIKLSTQDSCNVVRDTSRCILETLRTRQNLLFTVYFSENNTENNISNLIKSAPDKQIKISTKSESAAVTKTKKSTMGKAQRVKIVPS